VTSAWSTTGLERRSEKFINAHKQDFMSLQRLDTNTLMTVTSLNSVQKLGPYSVSAG